MNDNTTLTSRPRKRKASTLDPPTPPPPTSQSPPTLPPINLPILAPQTFTSSTPPSSISITRHPLPVIRLLKSLIDHLSSPEIDAESLRYARLELEDMIESRRSGMKVLKGVLRRDEGDEEMRARVEGRGVVDEVLEVGRGMIGVLEEGLEREEVVQKGWEGEGEGGEQMEGDEEEEAVEGDEKDGIEEDEDAEDDDYEDESDAAEERREKRLSRGHRLRGGDGIRRRTRASTRF